MKEALEAYSKGELNKMRNPQGESPNPVFRYDSDIEKESILKMKEERYACYVENDSAAAAIGEILMIIMTIIMAAVLLRSFT